MTIWKAASVGSDDQSLFSDYTPKAAVFIHTYPLPCERNSDFSYPFQTHPTGRYSEKITFLRIVSGTVKHISHKYCTREAGRMDFSKQGVRDRPGLKFPPLPVKLHELGKF